MAEVLVQHLGRNRIKNGEYNFFNSIFAKQIDTDKRMAPPIPFVFIALQHM